ncbi:hypothetical protein V3C99_005124 [Haemonchus contortus]|nr:unnamed protein product [Haemonchus contortus]
MAHSFSLDQLQFGDLQTQALIAGPILLVVGIGLCIVLWMLMERRGRAKKAKLIEKMRSERTTRTRSKKRHHKKKVKVKRYKKPPPPVKSSKKLRKALTDFLENQTQSIASEWNELDEQKLKTPP